MGMYIKESTALVLPAAPQAFTTSWIDCGAEFQTKGYKKLGLWINLDINAGVNARIRVLGKRESAGTDEYTLPIKTIGTSDVKLESEYFEFNVDADNKMILSIDLENLVPWCQVQIQIGTDSGADAQIDSLYYTLGN